MGDVALVAPAIKLLSEKYPQTSITIVTRKKFAVFFEGYKNIAVFEADFEKKYRGFAGLFFLFRDLNNGYKPDKIIDLHQNLRTAILKFFFFFIGVFSFTINKGRKEKKALTRYKNKIRVKLPHTVDRYLSTFEEAGLKLAPPSLENNFFKNFHAEKIHKFLVENNLLVSDKMIGVAPFAQHKQKTWDFENFFSLFEKIFSAHPHIKILLFGGGSQELEKLRLLKNKFPQVIIVAGQLDLESELALIKLLGLMICMDSGNMHLAALNGVPVLSIWGATHFYSGFGPYQQSADNILEINPVDLTCRPCSIFGDKPCFRGDLACLKMITPEMVFARFEFLIIKGNNT